MGLCYFKLSTYHESINHWKKCIRLNQCHKHAYNNLAFLYNMHQLWAECENICACAKLNIPESHSCFRHWAFALFKREKNIEALKKIKKAVTKDPTDSDNWAVWGIILKTVGQYEPARHKFKEALKLNPKNDTAKHELILLKKIIAINNQIEQGKS